IGTRSIKFEPFLLKYPESVRVFDIKKKISEIIGLEKYFNELIFEGALKGKLDSLKIEHALLNTMCFSKSPQIYTVGVVVPQSRESLINLPKELLIPQLECLENATTPPSRLKNLHGISCNITDPFFLYNLDREKILEIHKKNVNYIIIENILTKTILQASTLLSKVCNMANNAVHTFDEIGQFNRVQNLVGPTLSVLLLNLFSLLFISTRVWDTQPYPDDALYYFGVISFHLVILISVFSIFISQYVLVIRYYFANKPNPPSSDTDRNAGYLSTVTHVFQAVGEFFLSLFFNVV
ncbi:hypothetical protein HZS_175, partial [Henneguya salminicola]